MAWCACGMEIPCFLIAGLMSWWRRAPALAMAAPSQSVEIRGWWPDWRNKQIWRLGFLFGSVNSVYFATNAFLPGHLTELGRSDLVGAALTALNLGQVPASVVLLAISSRI